MDFCIGVTSSKSGIWLLFKSLIQSALKSMSLSDTTYTYITFAFLSKNQKQGEEKVCPDVIRFETDFIPVNSLNHNNLSDWNSAILS